MTTTLMTDGQNTNGAVAQQTATSQSGGQQATEGGQAVNSQQTVGQQATTQQQDGQQAATGQQDSQQAATGQQTQTSAQQTTLLQGTSLVGQQDQATTKQVDDKGQQHEGAPEKYEFKAPEGQQFDDAILSAYSDVARELNLPQNAAQQVIDRVAPVLQARQIEQIAAVQTAWAEEARSDKEFGGDKLDESLGVAERALETFGSPRLKELLRTSGIGNHPEIIRAFYRVGKATGGDSVVSGQGGATAQHDARRLYAASNMNP